MAHPEVPRAEVWRQTSLALATMVHLC